MSNQVNTSEMHRFDKLCKKVHLSLKIIVAQVWRVSGHATAQTIKSNYMEVLCQSANVLAPGICIRRSGEPSPVNQNHRRPFSKLIVASLYASNFAKFW